MATKTEKTELPDSFTERLSLVQFELKSPKNQFNAFGKYNYRNAEDILEAVKPLLNKVGFIMTISDSILFVEGRHYVVATIDVTDGKTSVRVQALAREEDNVKGMQAPQVSGSTSSYARKYALNGMFLIDDTKDSDSTNQHDKAPAKTTTAAQPKQEAAKAPEKQQESAPQNVVGKKEILLNTGGFTSAAKWVASTDVPTIEGIELLKTKYTFTPEVETELVKAVTELREAK